MNGKFTSLRSHRAIHLIDAENLVGGPMLSRLDVVRLRDAYSTSVPVGPLDHIVVATAHNSLLSVGAEWRGIRHEMRSGKDGADICLAEIVVYEHLAERFESIFIGSGDGGLAPFAAHLASQGASVTAVSRIGSLSPRMRLAASNIIYLDRPNVAAAMAS